MGARLVHGMVRPLTRATIAPWRTASQLADVEPNPSDLLRSVSTCITSFQRTEKKVQQLRLERCQQIRAEVHPRTLARAHDHSGVDCLQERRAQSVWRERERERAQLGAARRGSRPRRARPDASTRRVVEYDVNRAGPPADDLLLGRAREDREEVLRGRSASPD